MSDHSYYSRRFGAWIVDLLVAFSPLLIVAPFALTLAASEQASEQVVGIALIWLVLPIGVLAYLLLQVVQIGRGSPTPGRRLFSVEISREGSKAGFQRALVRQVAGGLVPFVLLAMAGFWPLAALGGIWSLIDGKKRSLADLISGLEVVVIPKETTKSGTGGKSS